MNGMSGVFTRKYIFAFVALVFILSVAPFLIISRYNHPSADDFSYGFHTTAIWQETGSLPRTFMAAASEVQRYWRGWQGTFTTIFLMTLHPAVFGDGYYALAAPIIILGFIGALFFFMKAFLMDYLGADKFSYGIVTCVIGFIFLQFIPSPVEGLFWYNASVFYTGMTSVALVMFGFMIKKLVLLQQKPSLITIHTLPITILPIIIGGGNFITSLTSFVILCLVSFFCFSSNSRAWYIPIGMIVAMVPSFLIAILAPGNAVRQELFEGMDAFTAISTSLLYGIHTDFIGYLRIPVLALFALITPLLYRIAKGSNLSFARPYLIIPLFYGVYASTFTPNLYAWSDLGPHRVLNINFFTLLMFLLFSIGYICGSIARKAERMQKVLYCERETSVVQIPSFPFAATDSSAQALVFMPVHGITPTMFYKRIMLVFYTLAFLVFGISSLSLIQSDVNAISGVSAVRSLLNGEAAAYHQEKLERLEVLRRRDVQSVAFHPFIHRPHVLFFYDITPYYDYWRNVAFARFYGIERAVIYGLP